MHFQITYQLSLTTAFGRRRDLKDTCRFGGLIRVRSAGEMADPRLALGSNLNSASYSLSNFEPVAVSRNLVRKMRLLVFTP